MVDRSPRALRTQRTARTSSRGWDPPLRRANSPAKCSTSSAVGHALCPPRGPPAVRWKTYGPQERALFVIPARLRRVSTPAGIHALRAESAPHVERGPRIKACPGLDPGSGV